MTVTFRGPRSVWVEKLSIGILIRHEYRKNKIRGESLILLKNFLIYTRCSVKYESRDKFWGLNPSWNRDGRYVMRIGSRSVMGDKRD